MQHEPPTRVAVVTGASREIGAAIVEALAYAGYAVVAAQHGEPERTEQLVARLHAEGRHAVAYDADLASVAANYALVAHTVATFGRLDVFVANAGLTAWQPFLETDEASWNRLFDLNLKGSFFGAQAAARQMIAQNSGGQIIFSSSVAGVRAIPGLAAYGVTKAGLRHMAQVLAVELGQHSITVNALGIGATLNERNLRDNPAYASDWGGVTPTGRVGLPSDVAQVVLFLVSPAAAMVNGQTLMVDGAWSTMGNTPR